MNRIQKRSKSAQREVSFKTASFSTPLHIDLYNFENPLFENSRYVLTSPRSLEACSRLNIKPAELLHKPLAEFERELVPTGVSLRTVYEMYDANEKERLNKLYLCRDEREMIVVEDSDAADEGNYLSPKIANAKTILKKNTTQRNKINKEKVAFQSGTKDDNSLQRTRTALATSVGHIRVTKDELNRRAKEIYEKGKKTIGNRKSRGPVKLKLPKKKQQHRHDMGERSQSATDISRASRPWVRTPTTPEALTITEKNTYHKGVNGRTTPTGRLTPRSTATKSVASTSSIRGSTERLVTPDQRLLQVMQRKREEERKLREKSEAARLKWERERKREQEAKEREEVRKRKSFAEFKKQQEYKKVAIYERRKSMDEKMRQEKEIAIKICDKSASSASQKAAEFKKRKQEELMRQNLERKKLQEERYEQQKREEEEFLNQVKEKQKRGLRRAHSMKETREQEIAMRAKFKNLQSKKKHEEKWSEMKRKSMDDLHNLANNIETKLVTAEKNVEKNRERKEQELKHSSRNHFSGSFHDLEYKLSKSKENQKKIQEQQDQWKEELMEYRKLCEKRAEEKANETVMMKKQKAEERALREKQARENLKKLEAKEAEWKHNVEASIALKEAKARMIQMEKDEFVQASRANAAASQKAREELRNAYSTNELDQLAKRAELEAKLGFMQLNTGQITKSTVDLA